MGQCTWTLSSLITLPWSHCLPSIEEWTKKSQKQRKNKGECHQWQGSQTFLLKLVPASVSDPPDPPALTATLSFFFITKSKKQEPPPRQWNCSQDASWNSIPSFAHFWLRPNHNRFFGWWVTWNLLMLRPSATTPPAADASGCSSFEVWLLIAPRGVHCKEEGGCRA